MYEILNDFVVLVGGTNNITKNSADNPKQFLRLFKEFLEKIQILFNHTNLLLCTIPYRYDLSFDSPENHLIKEANSAISQLAYNKSHVKLLDLWILERRFYTAHGLHVNKKGKKFVCKKICEIVNNSSVKDTFNSSLNPGSNLLTMVDQKATSAKQRTDLLTDKSAGQRLESPIQVMEQDIQEVIKRRDGASVAFAHCISGDFDNRRQMSRGVATIFKKEFGKPKSLDCVFDNLTLQYSKSGAAVYGLVTKKLYNSKPEEQDYNRAFQNLISDFKAKNLKKLICSPMGCVRDQISPETFSKNIVQLHRSTGAIIDIMVQDERSTRTRKLRRGLNHQDFVSTLRTCIAGELKGENCSSGTTDETCSAVHDNLQPIVIVPATDQEREMSVSDVSAEVSNSAVLCVSSIEENSIKTSDPVDISICKADRGSILNSQQSVQKLPT